MVKPNSLRRRPKTTHNLQNFRKNASVINRGNFLHQHIQGLARASHGIVADWKNIKNKGVILFALKMRKAISETLSYSLWVYLGRLGGVYYRSSKKVFRLKSFFLI